MKIKFLILVLFLLPAYLFCQNYEKEGDELFAQSQYEKAEKKYKAAIAIIGETPSVKQKQVNCSKCVSLLAKAQNAERESLYSNAAKYYSELYAIHPLDKYMSKANEMKQKVQKAKQIEQERLEKESETCDEVYMMAESMPEFPGGQQALSQYLGENVKYPASLVESGIHGTVICQFIVKKDGSITEVKVVRSGGEPSLDKEAIRVIELMPKWKPGKSRGRAVCIRYTLPIKF